MSEWDTFRENLKNTLYKKIVPKNPKNAMNEGERVKNGDFGGDSLKVSKNEYGNALLSTLDLRNVRPWSEGRYSPRHAQKPPGPQTTAAPEAARCNHSLAGSSQKPAPPQGQRAKGAAGKAPVPGTMRWNLLPCALVPVVLELDAGGALTWQAGQFDEHVRALCSEHGPQIRAFLATLPGRRWESWRQGALDLADQWETSQEAQQGNTQRGEA